MGGPNPPEYVLERAMSPSVTVRCPACRRAHTYTAQTCPCVCGAPLAPPLDPAGNPVAVTHRTWAEEWLTLRCTACGRRSDWPRPELGCPCGTMLRIPVTAAEAARAEEESQERSGTPDTARTHEKAGNPGPGKTLAGEASGREALERDLYDTVREEARAYAFRLRVPEPVKVTTVAPTGSIAKMPGVTEGVHTIYRPSEPTTR